MRALERHSRSLAPPPQSVNSPGGSIPLSAHARRYNDPMTKLLHFGQRERERLQERRDQVYDELQRLYALMDQAKQRAPALEQEFAELQRRIGELEEDEIGAVLPEDE